MKTRILLEVGFNLDESLLFNKLRTQRTYKVARMCEGIRSFFQCDVYIKLCSSLNLFIVEFSVPRK